MIKKLFLFTLTVIISYKLFSATNDSSYYKGDNKYIQYTGRIDFSIPAQPKFWASGAYIEIKFYGSYCVVLINDEVRWNKVHNYIEIKVDDKEPYRLQLKEKENRIVLAQGLSKGNHTAVICKNTEAENGYLQVTGFICQQLIKPPKRKKRKIEFIGDSITCGFGSDETAIPCGKGEWYDEHNAWLAYGPITARRLTAQWSLSSVSGIGLIHSCCNKKILMPQVFDKINMPGDSIPWNFSLYQPDVVTVCLGQNDGIQDSLQFCNAYVQFVNRLRDYYPSAKIVLLTSPMAGPALNKVLKNYTSSVKDFFKTKGDKNVGTYAFSKQSNKGCGGHPSLQEQQEMANELSTYLKKEMKW